MRVGERHGGVDRAQALDEEAHRRVARVVPVKVKVEVEVLRRGRFKRRYRELMFAAQAEGAAAGDEDGQRGAGLAERGERRRRVHDVLERIEHQQFGPPKPTHHPLPQPRRGASVVQAQRPRQGR